METLVTLISSFFRVLFAWCPRLYFVRKTHGGVKFIWGKHTKKLEPGVHWYWPLSTGIEEYPVVRQTLNLTPQCLRTNDGKSIMVSGIVVYSVEDVEKLLVKTYDGEETVRDIAMAAIKSVITGWSLEDLESDHLETDTELGNELKEQLHEFGIDVERATLSDLAPCKVIKIVGINRGNNEE